MPIGPVTPGNYTTVTPDVLPAEVVSIQTPSPTMPVVAVDLAALTLQTLNIKQWIKEILVGSRVFNVILTGSFRPDGGIDVQPGVLVRVRNTATLQLDAGSTFYHHGTGLFRLAATTNIQIDGNFPVTGNVSCTDLDASGDVTCGGNLEIVGNTTCLDGITIHGTSTNTGTLSNSGAGRLRLQRATAINGNATYKWGGGGGTTALGDYIHYTATPGGNIVWTLDETGSGGGDVVDIYTTDSGLSGSGFTITITSSGGATTDAVLTGAAGFRAARMGRDAGTGKWRRLVYLE